MPNWLEGTMKFHGKREHVIKALNCLGLTQTEPDEDAEFSAVSDVVLPFGRAYVDQGTSVYLDYGSVVTGVVDNVNFAWSVREGDAEKMKDFSKVNGVEIKFYGYERGIGFEQDYYTDGESSILNTTTFKDWQWESRHPNLGG